MLGNVPPIVRSNDGDEGVVVLVSPHVFSSVQTVSGVCFPRLPVIYSRVENALLLSPGSPVRFEAEKLAKLIVVSFPFSSSFCVMDSAGLTPRHFYIIIISFLFCGVDLCICLKKTLIDIVGIAASVCRVRG